MKCIRQLITELQKATLNAVCRFLCVTNLAGFECPESTVKNLKDTLPGLRVQNRGTLRCEPVGASYKRVVTFCSTGRSDLPCAQVRAARAFLDTLSGEGFAASNFPFNYRFPSFYSRPDGLLTAISDAQAGFDPNASSRATLRPSRPFQAASPDPRADGRSTKCRLPLRSKSRRRFAVHWVAAVFTASRIPSIALSGRSQPPGQTGPLWS